MLLLTSFAVVVIPLIVMTVSGVALFVRCELSARRFRDAVASTTWHR